MKSLKSMRKKMQFKFFTYIILVVFAVTGWVKCVIKAVSCNWEPIGKAEVFYTVSCFIPPVGAVVGWIDIEDK